MKKVVKITIRDEDGYLIGVRAVSVAWRCPHCGGPMGKPEPFTFKEDGVTYTIDRWVNPCGHVARYKQLEVIGKSEEEKCIK